MYILLNPWVKVKLLQKIPYHSHKSYVVFCIFKFKNGFLYKWMFMLDEL